MRIYGTDHVIVNNYFEGLNGTKWDAPITLTQGDAIEGSSTDLTKHYRAERVFIGYNTLVNNDQGIEIGFTNNNNYTKTVSEVTIANNLITSNRNSLVKIVDGKDQGSAITWSNNLMYPTGAATLISGGTSTTLSNSSQVIVENPNLLFDNATSTWRTSATTALYVNTLNTVNTTTTTLNEEIEGKSRPSTSNPGAHHYSIESVRYMPMVAATVGPTAYEDIPLSLSPITSFTIAGENKATTVTTNLAWTATVDSPSWLSINNTSGTGNGSIAITATANTTGAARTGLLTVTGAGATPVTLAITQVGPTLTLSAVTNFIAGGEAKSTTVTSNVAWTANIDNASWLSINTASGTNNGSITVTAAANTLTTTRTGTLTVTGSSMAPTTLTITQAGVPSGATLINTGADGNPVSVTATNTQSGVNVATNTLDKSTSTKWSDDGTGAPFGTLTYDLGAQYTLESIKISTTGTSSKWYYYGIQFSTDGLTYTTPVNVQSAAASQTTYAIYPFTNVARYVKIIGGGNNSTAFTSVSEIEFWGTASSLSVDKNQLNNAFVVYPNPASSIINLYSSSIKTASKVLIYSMDGKQVLDKKLQGSDSNHFVIEINTLESGTYLLKILDDTNKIVGTKMIIVRN
jgi:hypothetical protein